MSRRSRIATRSLYKIAQDDRRRLAVYALAPESIINNPCGAQSLFSLKRCEPLILQIDWNIERQLEIACRASRSLRRITFRAVHTKRQTNDQCLRVKAFEQHGHSPQELFPVGPAQGRKRSDGYLQLVGDGHPDALEAEVERQQSPGGRAALAFAPAKVWINV